MAPLVNRTILIVGASSGIGAQVARDLAGHGNRVAIVARRAAEPAAVAADVRAAGSACLDLVADALDPAAAAAVVAEAGVEDIARVMALNHDLTVHCLVPLIAQLRRQRGGLVAQTNSLAGLMESRARDRIRPRRPRCAS
ncbi:SDR family NAD(P)-dependent oxidoreductase [Amycolatopsis sp. CA-126428]|uniref:SDR family NAD(P)-dependent oxidoreductase n=1 Tax=Amycolatopsis sp. CA-126428 TaxID=2073158 RepID=UPI001E5975A7|nr:SDR family NAD(P)-dependent oxidoreductase [Amycolatopsis sp. CA-126428]